MRVVCIGSGNVATHLARAFKTAGNEIVQVWSRSASHASELACIVGAEVLENLDEVEDAADLYLIAVKDDAIPEVAETLVGVQGVVVHTSGATNVDILAGHARYGVFYPLQTFSIQKEVDFAEVPLCVEAADEETLRFLSGLGAELGSQVYHIDSEKRRALHLAAAFACNFVNHLYTLSHTILEKHQMSFDMIRPLIRETADKVQADLPENVQTGPAVRNDKRSMDAHLEMLSSDPQLSNIYQILSNSIKKTQH
ncbi:Rossmann-like and DUF2520 domain-containing protein [Pedobacter faecalis]|uniref:Rossmann-like and DUF2520 domain-containing protein n=1 Tax=Pedobacter faecalis TaxID=3041495 RepID=UPI00254C5E00|nr:F420-dependent NADP oxidoreductase [Pedobacter sp. ELA7]